MTQYELLRKRANCQLRPIDEWPGKLTPYRKNSQFRARWEDSFSKLGDELNKIDAKSVVIQIAVRSTLWKNDGTPRVDVKVHDHPGIILNFTTKHGSVSMPCDTFYDWKDNVRAIALSLEALRAVDRYGVTKRGEQYKGWTAIPAAASSTFRTADEAAQWLGKVCGIDPQTYSLLLGEPGLSSAYRRAAAKLHPDQGGSHEDFVRLQSAKSLIERAMKR